MRVYLIDSVKITAIPLGRAIANLSVSTVVLCSAQRFFRDC